jgi:hypothetical protein
MIIPLQNQGMKDVRANAPYFLFGFSGLRRCQGYAPLKFLWAMNLRQKTSAKKKMRTALMILNLCAKSFCAKKLRTEKLRTAKMILNLCAKMLCAKKMRTEKLRTSWLTRPPHLQHAYSEIR